MASVPFYPVLGNHDIAAKLANTPDALGVYYFFAPPKGGPGPGPWTTPIAADESRTASFRAATEDSYPNLDAYSFDYGPAHFVVLNDNPAMKIESPDFLKWLSADLNTTKAKWKFVCFHIPGFQSSKQHYTEQQIRPLHPIFEECGVDMTFAGHVHNYQRSVPLKFAPEGKREKKGKVDGVFTLDTIFDGVKNTEPRGIVNMVVGGGGATLYGPGLDKTAESLKKLHGANYADFTAKMIADKHSFVVLDISPDRLDLRAIGATGDELDRIAITKKK
jgi:acid phosphatase type 7